MTRRAAVNPRPGGTGDAMRSRSGDGSCGGRRAGLDNVAAGMGYSGPRSLPRSATTMAPLAARVVEHQGGALGIMDVHVNDRLIIPAAEISLTASRSSGPGGQHVNTASTRVQLRWNLSESAVLSETQRRLATERLASRLTKAGELVLECGSYRSQRRNRDACLRRLAVVVRSALESDAPRHKTRPPAGAAKRRLADKKRRGALKRSRRDPTRDDSD